MMNSIRSRVAKLENAHHGERKRRVGVIYVPVDATAQQIADAAEAAGLDRRAGDGVIIHRMPNELLKQAPWQSPCPTSSAPLKSIIENQTGGAFLG